MKTVWILDYKITSWYDQALSFARSYRYDFFKKREIELIVLDMDYFDVEKWVFTHYKQQFWSFDLIEKDVIPEIIWLKTSKDRDWYVEVLRNKTRLFPSSKVAIIANDKRYTYKCFWSYQPKTLLLSDVIRDISLIHNWWKEVVIKPRTWYGWEWVEKVEITEIIDKYLDKKDTHMYIVQELCDFSHWYPWLTDTYHDVRLVYIWWKLTYQSLRASYKDFRANVSLWGEVKYLSKEELPKEIFDLGDELLWKSWWEDSWVVSFDFAFDSLAASRKLIELNYTPWFVSRLFKTDLDTINLAFDAYASVFVS